MESSVVPPGKTRDFKLIPWFAFTSLICIVLAATLSAYILQQFIEQNVLERDATVSRQFIQSAARFADPEPYLDSGEKIADRAQFAAFFENVIRMPEVLRVNIYDRNEVIVWSSNSQLAGTRSPSNDELKDALAGEMVVELNRRTSNDKLEYATLPTHTNWFLESYIPVRSEAGQVIGVAELYKSPDAILATLNKSQRLVWFTTGAGGLFLYVALFGFVRRASAQIQRQERALVASERMAAIGGMATSVAHNMRNPMASIRSSAELAVDEVGVDAKPYLEDIVAQVDRMNRWVTDLVQFSQVPTGEYAVTSLPELLDECIAEISRKADSQGVVIESRVPPDLPAVRGEIRLLKQVVSELLSNALQAMPQGGRLRVESDIARSGVEVLFCDDGDGIPADQIHRVFDPLYTRKVDGLGVGLPLARRILRASGATINLESTEGEGTTVKLRLAVADG